MLRMRLCVSVLCCVCEWNVYFRSSVMEERVRERDREKEYMYLCAEYNYDCSRVYCICADGDGTLKPCQVVLS